MRAEKILFATDFSPCSEPALGFATSLARDSGARLVIAHIQEPPIAYGGGEAFAGSSDMDHAELTQMLEKVVPLDPNVPYEHHLLVGDPADELVRLAGEAKVDYIVMGTHGRTGVLRLLMGSVAEAVVRRAPCPVVTIKQPDHGQG